MLSLILITAVLAALFYYLCVKPMNYWRNLGVIQTDHPAWLFGDNWEMMKRKDNFFDHVVRCYSQFPNARYHGIYEFVRPTLLIKDPELLRKITIKDFDHFMDHRTIFPEETDPLWGKNLFSLTGNKWRGMRPILSPSFTSSKMRTMFVLMLKCSENFVNHFLKKDQDCIEMEMKDSFTRFTNDVIATSAFGLRVDSLEEPNNEFYLMGKEATDFGKFKTMMRLLGYFLIPKLMKYLKVTLMDQEVNKFFCDLIDKTIKIREKNNIIRPDMIHLLMEAKKGVHHKDEDEALDTGFATVMETDIGKGHITKLTNLDITAQALIFFFAGFDSVSSLLCFTSHELAINPNIQTTLRMEIEETLAECGGQITYEALLKMKYMDMVISESLRKWPPTLVTDRVCTRPYTMEAANSDEQPIHIEKGTALMIPIVGIHRDPKYYPNPTRFDPERFGDENKEKIVPFTYMPFGLGPRNCIGSRLALLEIKLLLFHLLSNFELVPVEKTPIPLKLSRKTFIPVAEGGFWLGLKRLKK